MLTCHRQKCPLWQPARPFEQFGPGTRRALLTSPPGDRIHLRLGHLDHLVLRLRRRHGRSRVPRDLQSAGVPHFHPHDLRHRYASVKLREGVPLTDLAAQLGHAKKSLTLDTYSHVLVD